MPANRRSNEGGVILILTLFVILITYALVAQLTIGTSVAYQTAKNGADRIRMRTVAMSASDEILRLLADDAPGGEEEGAAADAASGLGDAGGFGDQGADPGTGEEEEGEEEEEDDGSNSDSFEDEWSRSARFPIGDMEVTAFVQDENSKFNILTLFQADPDLQAEARDRFVRILDHLREDFDDDLDDREANTIMEELVVWVEGDNRDLDMPVALHHSNNFIGAAEEAVDEEGQGADPAAEEPEDIVYEVLYLPFSLEELMLLEHVAEELFYDQMRDNDEIAPGLESVLTVYTTVALDPPSANELASSADADAGAAGAGSDVSELGSATAGDDQSGADSGSQDGLEESPSSTTAEGGLDDLLEAGGALGHAINLNTAPVAVLRGLLPTEQMPESMIDAILEYRNKVDEEALAEQEGEDVDYKELELRRSLYREDNPIPHQYFRSLEDLNEVDGWEDRLDPEQREAFQALVGVQSDIFSIYLYCRLQPDEWQQEHHYEEAPGPILRLKAVVWRRMGENGAKFLFIEPWHEVTTTRWRIPDFQDELGPYELPEW